MFLKYNFWAFLWGLVVFITCAIPGDQLVAPPFPHFDKYFHFFMYGLLQVLLSRGFYRQTTSAPLKSRAIYYAGIICFVYGVIIEILQGLVFSQRSFDVADIAANSAGIIAGSFIWTLIQKSTKKN